MRVGALGPVEVLFAPAAVNLGGPKPKALLAALMLEPGHVVALDRLIDLIWDEQPPRSAVALVHTYVSALRRGFASIGEQSALATRTPGYLLEVDPADVDLVMFARQMRDARQAERDHDHTAAAEAYRLAATLWRGPAFGGVDAQFARTRATALEDERLAAQEGLARCELALGQVSAALSRLTVLSAAHPLREDARGLLMRALYLSGRQGDALAAYRTGREHLINELGVEPGPALRELHAHILDGTLPTTPDPAHPAVTLPARRPQPPLSVPNQLPPDVADFTGRAEQVDRVVRLGRSAPRPVSPIIVVSGVGGAGKSALAVHCAHLLAADYPDGQLFADLQGAGPTLNSADVLGRFLRALGVSSTDLPDSADERAELYRMTVANRRSIIVLDNVRGEHQVRQLLPGSGNCLVIITSRSRLTGIAGAEPVELDTLSVGASIEMLSRIIGPDRVAADPEAAATIARLCGGIPLAIRVAGAKLLARAHWPLRMLAHRLSDERRRLDELAVGDLAIRSSLRVHYDELDEPQRRAFHLLTLLGLPDFGAWVAVPLLRISPAAADEIVEQLVDLRLLEVVGVDKIGRIRYRFHDLVRLFGAEAAMATEPAAEIQDAVSRTLSTWMALVEAGAKSMPRATLGLRPELSAAVELAPAMVAEVEADPTEWFNSETLAVVRIVERAHELGVDEMTTTLIASLLSSPFASRNEFDGWQRTHDIALSAARGSGNRRAEAMVLTGLGHLFYERDDFPAALRHFQQAADIAAAVGDATTEAVALVGIGTVHRDCGRFTAAIDILDRAATLAAGTGDRATLATATYGLGAVQRDHGSLEAAEPLMRRCVQLYQDLSDLRGHGLAVRGLSLVHRARGELDEAARLGREAHALLVSAGDERGATYTLQSLAKTRLRQGRFDGLAVELEAGLEVCRRYQDRFGLALVTRTLGELALARGELALARGELAAASTRLGTALGLWEELGLALWQARTLRDLAAAESARDPELAARHWARAMELFAETGGRELIELRDRTPAEFRTMIS